MASTVEFVEYICEQINECGRVNYKKMFGEYMVYLHDRPIFLICNDTLYVKISEETTVILGEKCEQDFPYKGSKLRYVVSDIDNRELIQKLAFALEKITPIPKGKRTI